MNDTNLWGQMVFTLCDAGLEAADAESIGRRLVGLVRRDRQPRRRTWVPGDALPEPPPQRVVDLDGDTWEHQDAGHGCYRMSCPDRAKHIDSSEDVDGVRPWPSLLEFAGPVTER